MRTTDPHPWVIGWRRIALAAGLLAYPAVAATGIHQYTTGATTVLGYGLLLAYAAAYILAITAAAQRPAPRRILALTISLTALYLGLLPFAHETACYLLAVPVALAAAFVSRRQSMRIIGTGTLAALLIPWAYRPLHEDPAIFPAIATLFTAITVYSFSELAAINKELVEARTEIARLASEAERNRIARDLHDLLGHSLTVITLKSGLARRAHATDPDRSIQEITEVEQLSRQALTDVRAAVSGYREVTLTGELAQGRELLRASGIIADLPTAADAVHPAYRELFGWLLREGLTNVVRHSQATQCTVSLTSSTLEIRDNGTGGDQQTNGAATGNGLKGLRERVTTLGGIIDATPVQPSGWSLRASLPPTPADNAQDKASA